MSDFESNEESESEVDSETEEEVLEESSSTESNSESPESIQTAKPSKQSTSTPKTKKKSNLSWESKKFQPPQCDVPDISLKLKVNNGLKRTSAPIDFFNLFCDNNFFVQICQETNFYNVQRSTDGFMEAVPMNNKRRTSFKRLKLVTVNEIKRTICIILYMGISKLPNQRIYWGSRPAVPIISKSMRRDRFEDILSILHFSDNKKVVAEGQDGHNNCTRYNR